MTKKNDELMHYGVIGMHWGIRRYQPYSTAPRGSGKGGREIGEAAKVKSRISKTGNRIDKLSSKKVKSGPRSIQRRMNQIEKETIANAYEARKATERKQKLGEKAGKRGLKAVSRRNGPTNRDMSVMEKYAAKANKEDANIKAANANIAKGRSETKKLISMAKESGYSVSSKERAYFQEQGNQYVAQILGGPIAGAAYQLARGMDAYEIGNRYSVKKTRKRTYY